MIAPDELLAWTDAEIEDEIRRLAPADSDLVCEWQEGAWSVRLVQLSGALHASLHVDRRMALYDVYGHLWLERQPGASTGSAWSVASSRPTTASVSRYVRSRYGDPEDLDPSEVAAVYGLPSSKQGRY